ncbi:HEAT repeat domain-containing protein [Sorangium sp. So ce388]|uniref:HEAT repeat domain-containing protein n=1 Tax=Sorangium sp. So ce388 TaxID=3133309 RepID=UPI003F5B64B0
MFSSITDLVVWRAERVPALKAFLRDVSNELSSGHPDAFWACAPIFEALVQSNAVRDLVRAEIERAAEEPLYAPPSSAEALSIVDMREFSLLLKLVRPATPGEQLHSLSEHLYAGVLGSGRLSVDVYGEAPGYRNDVFDRTRRLRAEGMLTLGPREVAGFRAGEQLVHFDGSPEGTLTLFFMSSAVQRLRWVYDPSTLKAVRAHACDRTESRLDFVAAALGELGAAESIPALDQLCEHPAHFVRWSALRSLLRVDFDRGVGRLTEAQRDDHPHVRNGAQRALARLEARRSEA